MSMCSTHMFFKTLMNMAPFFVDPFFFWLFLVHLLLIVLQTLCLLFLFLLLFHFFVCLIVICPWLLVLKKLCLMDLRILVLIMGLNMSRILLHVIMLWFMLHLIVVMGQTLILLSRTLFWKATFLLLMRRSLRMSTKMVGKSTSMLNFGQKMHLMNGRSFVVLTFQNLLLTF